MVSYLEDIVYVIFGDEGTCMSVLVANWWDMYPHSELHVPKSGTGLAFKFYIGTV